MATPTPTRATRMAAWRRAAAALCIALAAVQHSQVNAQAMSDSDSFSTPSSGGGSIPFGVAGVSTSAPISGSDSSNAAVQPQARTVTLDELRALVNRSSSDNGVAIVNPFSRAPTATPTSTPTATLPPAPNATKSRNNNSSSTNSSTPTPTPTTPAPSATLVIETATAPKTTTTAPELDRTERVEGTAPPSDAASASSSSSFTEGLSRARARPNAGRIGLPTETPTPAPQDDEELWFESPSPSVSKKSTNAISFDVVRPQSSSDSGETDAATATQAPSKIPATQAPSSSPASTPPPTPTVKPTTNPVQPGTPMTTPPSSAVPGVREGQNPNVAPDAKTPAPSDKGVALLAEVAPAAPAAGGGQPGPGHSSFSGEPTVGHSKKGNSTAGSSSSSESTESSNQSGSSLYSMGTASIMSIVGVIVGICVIVSLFVLISRRKYENDDDDHDVLNYGGGGIKLNLDGRGTNSIVRLSPTFLMNGMAAPAPGQPIEPDFGSMSPHQIMASNRGRAPTGAVPEPSPAIMEDYAPQQRNLANEGGPSPSAFDSTDDFSTLDSRGSDGWSSVLESDFDHRSASRCTRDTTFSNITMSQNYSEFNPADLRSGTFRSTTAPRRPGGDSAGTYRRTTKESSQTQEYDIDEETASVMSFDVDESNNVNGARSTGASSFRLSGYSDIRSTGQSFDQSLRSTGPYM